jgi:sugar lactone lactonase YvrE
MGDWGCLLWSDIPNHRVLRWCEDDGHVSVYQTESGYSNGHTRDNQGRLIACEHTARWSNTATPIASRQQALLLASHAWRVDRLRPPSYQSPARRPTSTD